MSRHLLNAFDASTTMSITRRNIRSPVRILRFPWSQRFEIGSPSRIMLCLALTVVMLALVLGACDDGKPVEDQAISGELYIYNWEDYFAPDTLSNFEEEFGVTVHLETFEVEEAILGALSSDPARYDIVVASGSIIEELLGLKLLAPINLGNVPNLENLDAAFLNLYFDSEGEYSVPYLWGTTGLAINSRLVDPDVGSWDLIWDPAYGGHIAILDDPREAFTMSLISLGFSGNSSDPQEIEAAGLRLQELTTSHSRYMGALAIQEAMEDGEIWVGQMYNGDAITAQQENPDIVYLIPKEGAPKWIDNLGDSGWG